MLLTKLFAYQAEGVERIDALGGRALLADDMGLGKSIQALAYIDKYQIDPAVIVCPASLKWNWEHEVVTHLGRRVEILSSRSAPRTPLRKNGIYVLNYEILHYWLDYLAKLKPGIVVCDEAHYLKTASSQRFKAAAKLVKKVDKLILITGTPMTNRPIELYPLLRLLHPKNYRSRLRFGFKYCEPKHTAWGWQFRGATNLKKLNRVLKKRGMIRRRKSEVMSQLPPKRQVVVPLDISNRKEYTAALADTKSWLHANYRGDVDSRTKMQALVQVGELKRLAAKLKMKAVFEWIDNWIATSKEKLIVYGIHKARMKELRERYNDISVTVTGDTPQAKRKDAFESFNTSKRIQLLFGNLIAAGQGWSARRCSNVAKIEIDWVPGNHSQASDRTHGVRRGQEGVQSTTWWLVAHDTIEDKLCQIVQKKQGDIDRAIDGRKYNELNVFDLLVDAMKKGE